MTPDRRTLVALAALVIGVAGTLSAHDMFLKLESFFLRPHATATVALLNGTFEASENVITRDRMEDVSVVGPAGVVHPPASAWRDTAMHHWHADSVDTALLEFETGAPGTYVIGVSTKPRVFTLSAREFDDYLEHDGVLDVLEARRAEPSADSVTERYSKHVKAVVQVGDARSDEFSVALEYPIEFIPLRNPYALGVGDTLEVRLEFGRRPVPNQLVYASYEGHHGHAEGEEHEHTTAVATRTDDRGIARIPLRAAGKWFVRTIHMVETTAEPDVDYESNWATLTFEVR